VHSESTMRENASAGRARSAGGTAATRQHWMENLTVKRQILPFFCCGF